LPDTAAQTKTVTKRYGDVATGDRVSILIIKGEFLSLLGTIGFGKITLPIMLSGSVSPYDSEIYIKMILFGWKGTK